MITEYTVQQLHKQARALVKGLGRFDGYSIIVTNGVSNPGATLRAFYIEKFNPRKPKGLQAREFQSMAL